MLCLMSESVIMYIPIVLSISSYVRSSHVLVCSAVYPVLLGAAVCNCSLPSGSLQIAVAVATSVAIPFNTLHTSHNVR